MKVLCTACGDRFEAKGNVDLSRQPLCPACQQAKPSPQTLEVAIHEQTRFDDRAGEDQKLKEREVRG